MLPIFFTVVMRPWSIYKWPETPDNAVFFPQVGFGTALAFYGRRCGMFWLIDLIADGNWGQVLLVVALVVGIMVLLLS
jgi:hypothetical protein